MRKTAVLLAAVALVGATAFVSPGRALLAIDTDDATLVEYRLPTATLQALRAKWLDRIRATHADGTWAQLKVVLDDADLAAMGLPTAQTMKAENDRGGARRVREDRTTESATGLTFAGTGWFGIRPGAWLLVSTDEGTSLCSAAHVYGTPGNYQISTAGHCGNVGDVVTMLGAVQEGDTIYPVLVDIGRFSVSHLNPTDSDGNDRELGNDWGLVDVFDSMQGLVSPTMAFWGGPQGMFTAEGDVLPTQIVHYGHGLVLGTGGTPRTGTAMTWGQNQFTFFGAITPGDSGSGANVLFDPAGGGVMEAGGIITHLWVDASFEQGYGIMGGTRATVVTGALANGDLVASPLP
jgi:hypothetical protein